MPPQCVREVNLPEVKLLSILYYSQAPAACWEENHFHGLSHKMQNIFIDYYNYIRKIIEIPIQPQLTFFNKSLIFLHEVQSQLSLGTAGTKKIVIVLYKKQKCLSYEHRLDCKNRSISTVYITWKSLRIWTIFHLCKSKSSNPLLKRTRKFFWKASILFINSKERGILFGFLDLGMKRILLRLEFLDWDDVSYKNC